MTYGGKLALAVGLEIDSTRAHTMLHGEKAMTKRGPSCVCGKGKGVPAQIGQQCPRGCTIQRRNRAIDILDPHGQHEWKFRSDSHDSLANRALAHLVFSRPFDKSVPGVLSLNAVQTSEPVSVVSFVSSV